MTDETNTPDPFNGDPAPLSTDVIPAPVVPPIAVPPDLRTFSAHRGTFANAAVGSVPTWYLAHLLADQTGDGLHWADLNPDEQAVVRAEVERRRPSADKAEAAVTPAVDTTAVVPVVPVVDPSTDQASSHVVDAPIAPPPPPPRPAPVDLDVDEDRKHGDKVKKSKP